MSVIHPVKLMQYDRLIAGLDACIAAGTVRESVEGDLSLFHYTDKCQYDVLWNEYSLLARGLIIKRSTQEIIATPFPKFFNFPERGIDQELPDEPFSAFAKLDGSLGIVFWYNDQWCCVTKGAFGSQQAAWGYKKLCGMNTAACLEPGATYLFELIYNQNYLDSQLVVQYDYEDMVLLGGYSPRGVELSYRHLKDIARVLQCRVVERFDGYKNIIDLKDDLSLPGFKGEGFVLHYWMSGQRFKFKSAEYIRLHKLRSRLTPLGVWELLAENESVSDFQALLPEELSDEFNRLHRHFIELYSDVVYGLKLFHEDTKHMTDKELGIYLHEHRGNRVERYIFYYRKAGPKAFDDPVFRRKLFQIFRPTGNVIEETTSESSTVAG